MTNLFNTVDRSDLRLTVFLNLVEFASKADLLHLLKRYFEDADKWVSSWQLSKAQARELFLLVTKCLDAHGDKYVKLSVFH